MKLIVTIDTEEDNWGNFAASRYTLGNIERIPTLQELFDHFAVKPTYLITYPVATDERAVSVLRTIFQGGRCEIGAHCHPWNTPPFQGRPDGPDSMLCNLPRDLQYAKMKSLHETIRKRFGVAPLSFRSGRFGYNNTVAQNLRRLDYKIDTSITPYTDWSKEHGPDFTHISPRPFKCSSDDAFQESPHGDLIEVPATIGFLQANFDRRNSLLQALTRRPLKYLRLAGILNRLRLLNKVWLSPELANGRTMIALAKRMIAERYDILNMTFHSPSLEPGLTPFVETKDDAKQFYYHLRQFLTFATDAGIESIRLSDLEPLV